MFGETVTFSATVSQDRGVGPTPTGSVQFRVDGTNFGAPVALDGAGQAQLVTLGPLVSRAHTVDAVFSDGGNFDGSTAPGIGQTVSAATTTTVVGSSHATSVFGESVTFSATVTADSPSQATPIGDVQFTVDGDPFGRSGRSWTAAGHASSVRSRRWPSVTTRLRCVFTDADQFVTSTDGSTQTVTAAPTTTTVTPTHGVGVR